MLKFNIIISFKKNVVKKTSSNVRMDAVLISNGDVIGQKIARKEVMKITAVSKDNDFF